LRAGRRRGLAGDLVDQVLPRRVRGPRHRERLPVQDAHRPRGARRGHASWRRRGGLDPAQRGARLMAADLVTLSIDGKEVTVPKGTLIIRAAEQLGVEIPRFCDHPYLDPIGACRQCYVEVEGQRKLMTSCTTPVAPDMVVKTQNTSDQARKAQVGNLEFLLLNHPLDCPICDRGGECPLQDQALAFGPGESRYVEPK